ncbi:MAG: glycosyltransferase family 39 protein [Paenibacillus sp.]|nr:glycosyltransferase family 39 protein [Paenibacillus sp.]
MFFKYKMNNKFMLFAIILLAITVRFIYFLTTPFPLTPDKLLSFYPDENVYYGNYLLIVQKGFIGALLDQQSLWTAPLNSIYIYLLAGITSKPILFIRLVNILIASVSIIYLYKIAVKMFNVKVALFSSLFMAVYFPLIEISPTLLTEPLYILFLLMSGYYLLLATENNNYKHYILSGVIIGLATLTRSTYLLVPFFLVFFLFIHFRKNRKMINGFIIMLGMFMIMVGPFFLKNLVMFDRLTLNNGSGAVLFLGSRADTEGDEPPYRGKGYDTYEITTPYQHLESEGDDKLKKVAIDNIKNHFPSYMYWNIKKIGRLLVGNNYYWFFPFNDVSGYYHNLGLTKALFKITNMFLVIFVVIFGWYEILVSIFRKGFRNPITLIIIYHTLVMLPFLTNHRYGLPIICFISIFCASHFFKEKKVN